MRILVTGVSGFVGQNLARYFMAAGHQVVGGYRSTPLPSDLAETIASVSFDIRDPDAIRTALADAQPEVVLHAAGNKNLRDCEDHPEEAHETNAIGPRNVARACRESAARMVYISTDLVFPCTDGWYKETDEPVSTLVYGRTKRDGEVLIRQELSHRQIICRSGGLYGKGSPLLRWLACNLSRGQAIDAFTDVLNTPTFAWNLGEMLESILTRNLFGVFHTVGPDRVSRFELFSRFARVFDLDGRLLRPCQAGPRGTDALLQRDASLASGETQARVGVPFEGVARGLTRLRNMGGA